MNLKHLNKLWLIVKCIRTFCIVNIYVKRHTNLGNTVFCCDMLLSLLNSQKLSLPIASWLVRQHIMKMGSRQPEKFKKKPTQANKE